jgi:hypothetical protein
VSRLLKPELSSECRLHQSRLDARRRCVRARRSPACATTLDIFFSRRIRCVTGDLRVDLFTTDRDDVSSQLSKLRHQHRRGTPHDCAEMSRGQGTW